MDVSSGNIFQPQSNLDSSGFTAPSVASVTTPGTAVTGSLQSNNGSPNVAIYNQTQYDAMVNLGPAGLAAASATNGMIIPARALIVINVSAATTNYSVWVNGLGNVLMYRGTGG